MYPDVYLTITDSSNDVHKVRIQKDDQQRFKGLDDEAIKDLFVEILTGCVSRIR